MDFQISFSTRKPVSLSITVHFFNYLWLPRKYLQSGLSFFDKYVWIDASGTYRVNKAICVHILFIYVTMEFPIRVVHGFLNSVPSSFGPKVMIFNYM